MEYATQAQTLRRSMHMAGVLPEANLSAEVGCAETPEAPPLSRMVVDPSAPSLVRFGETISLTCQPGLRFAGGDPEAVPSVEVKCAESGWLYPPEWPVCVDSELGGRSPPGVGQPC